MCKSFPDFVSLLLDAAATVDKNEEHCYAVRTTASTAQQTTNVFNNNHNNNSNNNNNESSNKRYRNRSRNVKKQDSLRKKHNDMEKSRRANHKNLFLDLKLTLPPSLRSCRMSQIKTLNVAAQFIKESHEQYLRLTNEYEAERRKHFEYSSKLQMITRSHSRSSIESCADSGRYSCKSSSSSFSSSSPTALRDLDDNDVSSVDNDVTTNDDDVVATIGDKVDGDVEIEDDSDSIIIDVM